MRLELHRTRLTKPVSTATCPEILSQHIVGLRTPPRSVTPPLPGQLCQAPSALSDKKCFLILNPNLPWHNFRPLTLILSASPQSAPPPLPDKEPAAPRAPHARPRPIQAHPSPPLPPHTSTQPLSPASPSAALSCPLPARRPAYRAPSLRLHPASPQGAASPLAVARARATNGACAERRSSASSREISTRLARGVSPLSWRRRSRRWTSRGISRPRPGRRPQSE